MRPVIREHVSILDMDSSDVRFFCSHRRQMFHFSIDDTGRRALTAADYRRSVAEIMEQVGARHLRHSDVAGLLWVAHRVRHVPGHVRRCQRRV